MTSMTGHATGAFDVQLTPQASEDEAENALGRLSIAKRFHGDLEGTSTGQMLTAGTGVKGSAGYVAIERVNGSLQGRTGTFAFQHSGTMTRGEPQLSITVVPDSGTGHGQDDDSDRGRKAFVRLRVRARPDPLILRSRRLEPVPRRHRIGPP